MPCHKNLSIIISPQAKNDLRDILQYTKEEWGVRQKNIYKKLLSEGIKNIGENPYIGRLKLEISARHRVLKVKKHLIVYRLYEDKVQVSRILHQKMDFESKY